MKEAFIFFAGLLMVSGFACKSSRAVSNISSLPVMRIDPGPDNPRNSEGDFITLKDGRIVLIYSRYFGESGDDHATAKLTRRESKDGGKTWSTDDKVVVEKEGTMNVMSVSLLRLQNGKIALFYLRKNSQSDCIPMMRLSDDEAATWTDPIPCITDKKGYFVLNNDRVIQLQNGRLVMAVALHQTPEENKWHNNATLFSYYSDDNGVTWHSGAAVANPGNVVFQEPGVAELKNGDLMMIIRAGAGVQYKTYSKDKGESWSACVPTTIQSPLSPATIQRIPSTGDLVMAWNNNGANNPPMKGKRTPFSLAISKDDGNTWQHIRDIETDPDGWYCYTAMHFNKKNILLGYCAGSQVKKTHLSVLAVRQFPIKQLYK
ncbi:sialidase family protein [Terrimonas sp.]|uniref:sialidase family protein n=1 Tax=Terrimonas sp. TaxID=1914338 RepID=UPI001F0C3559|nr:sialidase family protein [Terrimonas sp.]